MIENAALRAFAATLRKDGDEVPLASETYLRLAKRHALHGRKRPPSFEEGRRFARVVLAGIKNPAFFETDWDRSDFIKITVDSWLASRDPDKLGPLIEDSEESAIAWDVLELICQKVADELAYGDPDELDERLPYELLEWYLMANYGYPERPPQGPGPSHRPRKLGYRLRDNEVRHTVDLLVQVDMPKTAARKAVAVALHLELVTIQRICLKPYTTIEELNVHAMKSMEPYYYELYYEDATYDAASALPPHAVDINTIP